LFTLFCQLFVGDVKLIIQFFHNGFFFDDFLVDLSKVYNSQNPLAERLGRKVYLFYFAWLKVWICLQLVLQNILDFLWNVVHVKVL